MILFFNFVCFTVRSNGMVSQSRTAILQFSPATMPPLHHEDHDDDDYDDADDDDNVTTMVMIIMIMIMMILGSVCGHLRLHRGFSRCFVIA